MWNSYKNIQTVYPNAYDRVMVILHEHSEPVIGYWIDVTYRERHQSIDGVSFYIFKEDFDDYNTYLIGDRKFAFIEDYLQPENKDGWNCLDVKPFWEKVVAWLPCPECDWTWSKIK